jgi:hypothetical protein
MSPFDQVIIREVELVRVEVGIAGPPGPPGSSGGGAALAVAARLSEFNTEIAKAQARANLGLETIDGGTFF